MRRVANRGNSHVLGTALTVWPRGMTPTSLLWKSTFQRNYSSAPVTCLCPPRLPAGFYWYGGQIKSPGCLPPWLARLLSKETEEPEMSGQIEDTVDDDIESDFESCLIKIHLLKSRLLKRLMNPLLSHHPLQAIGILLEVELVVYNPQNAICEDRDDLSKSGEWCNIVN